MKAQPYRNPREHPAVSQAAAPAAGRDDLLPVLQQVQAVEGHLSRKALGAAADRLRLPDAEAYGVASFYSMLATQPQPRNLVRLCDGPVCQLAGSAELRPALEAAAQQHGYCVQRTSCLGLCDRAPACLVNLEACGPLTPDLAQFVVPPSGGQRPSYHPPRTGETRIALARLGHIDPDDIDSALRHGAYQSLAAALARAPDELIRTIADSGLQGRGGAGFPTGRKWQAVAVQPAQPKYIVCNADESEPAAFKDRVLMEEDPHLLLEGMALAGYAVGAHAGYIYIRGEYEFAARRLERAIAQAHERGWLGDNIQSSGFSFSVHVHRGAGAYICGEETALLESLEGRRGEPRTRPPFPVEHGLYGKPTVVNNVETLCKAPAIVAHGAAWYRTLGTPASPGTKLFTITGHVARPGLFEAPYGITLREAIDQFAGGMRGGSSFKLALTGGAAGTIVGPEALDVPLDFQAWAKGVSLGAGAVFVCDQSVPVPRLLSWLVHFFQVESCGKCTPCREGTVAVREVVDRLAAGNAQADDLAELRRLSRMLRLTSFCGLGQSVAWPIDSALVNFASEFPSE